MRVATDASTSVERVDTAPSRRHVARLTAVLDHPKMVCA
jgi:hypothetical protein